MVLTVRGYEGNHGTESTALAVRGYEGNYGTVRMALSVGGYEVTMVL